MSDPAPGAPAVDVHLVFEEQAGAFCTSLPPPAQRWLNLQGWRGEKNRVVLIPGVSGEIAAVAFGLGKQQGEPGFWHGAALAASLPAGRFRLAQPLSPQAATAVTLGFAYGGYRYARYRKAPVFHSASLDPPANADLAYVQRADRALRRGRHLIDTPASDLGPAQLVEQFRQLADRHQAQFDCWRGEALLTAGFPAVHAVGRASSAAPAIAQVRWAGQQDAASLPQIVLLGKGVCFDSGGLDIKPASGMLLMKKDMGGAAAVLALAEMLMSARIRARLRILVPAVENSVSGNAYRPGDVLVTRKGLSVEVGNTDAEGRLVLCDALAAADEEPCDLIIDFATLTGAARVALGPELPALFGTDMALVDEVAACGMIEEDPLWPMPLWSSYEDELASKVADLCNVSASSFAGAIFGALFLKRFVSANPRWMHVDLYAWNARDRPGRPVGAELQGVRAFHRFLINRYGVAA